MPILSICIPTYNRAHCLKKTLLSITSDNTFLTTDDIEIVISDNASTDDTQRLCLEYSKRFPYSIKYIRQEKCLPADINILKVLEYATGTYIKLHNDTFLFKTNILQTIIHLIKNRSVEDILFFLNGNSSIKDGLVTCSTINDFISTVSYYITWIGAFCVKKEIYNTLANPERYAGLALSQVDILLRLIDKGHAVTVYFPTVFDSCTHIRKGGYNIATVFGNNYLSILKEYLEIKKLTPKIFEKEKKRVLLKHIIPLYFDYKERYSFKKDAYFAPLKDYKYNLYFYLSLIPIATKITKNTLIKKLFTPMNTFKKKWRRYNKHNFTTPLTLFGIHNVFIGKMCYGALEIYSSTNQEEFLSIGDNVSIAKNVIFLLGRDSSLDTVDRYPFTALTAYRTNEEKIKSHIIVEDGVWIGDSSLILAGVTIGQGSIITEASLVTENIPPYSIAGGNPAHIIAYRFPRSLSTVLKQTNTTSLRKENIISSLSRKAIPTRNIL